MRRSPRQLEAPGLRLPPRPGNALAGVCGQIPVAEGRRGLRAKTDLERVEQSERPIVLSLGR